MQQLLNKVHKKDLVAQEDSFLKKELMQGPGGSQERFGCPGGQFSQERNDAGPGECQDQVSNYTGNKE